jgi:hypothetical protein
MKLKKFTFKTTKPTGRYRSFESHYHAIKLNKIVVGYISDKIPHTIHLMVIKKDINEDGNKNCPWKWIKLKKESQSLEEAKNFLNEILEKIHSTFTFPKE